MGNFTLRLCCVLIVFQSILLFVEGVIVLGHNERCELYDETSSCDHSVGLMCINSGLKGYRCKCPNDAQFGTVYDPKRNKCVGKALNSCVPAGDNVLSPSPSTIPSLYNPNDTLCVENAECNTKIYHLPICMCKKGFLETDEGYCSPVAKYGEPCDNDKIQCDSKYGLSCNATSKCGCREESHQFYDQREEKCVTYIGGNCTYDNECVSMGICLQELSDTRLRKRDIFFGSLEHQRQQDPTLFFTHNRLTSIGKRDGKCACRPGYARTKGGFCMPSYGSPCHPITSVGNDPNNNTDVCNSEQFLECLGMGHHDSKGKSAGFRCQCRNPLSEKWDRKLEKCVSQPGKRCRTSDLYAPCAQGSECVRGVCHCKKGTSLAPGGEGECKLDFNEPCTSGQCNEKAGLTCHGRTGTCLCVDSYLNYNSKRRACLAELGSPCGFVDLQEILRDQRTNVFQMSGNKVQEDGKGKEKESMIFIDCGNGATCELQKDTGFHLRNEYKCVGKVVEASDHDHHHRQPIKLIRETRNNDINLV